MDTRNINVPRSYTTPRLEVVQVDYYKDIINHIYFSCGMQIFYMFLIASCMLISLWIVTHIASYPDHLWFFIVEILLSSFVILEVLIRFFLLGSMKFWISWSNRFDSFVAFLCVIGIAITVCYFAIHDIEETVGISLLVIRNSISLIRVVVFFKNQDRALLSSVHLADNPGILDDFQSSLVPERAEPDQNEDRIIINF
ncbi:unnamed protein product [Blepharisma stoltei]|uniref:Uncharacterized protein n=1 Tax=Blepharisma stoltei TaxID=1481888 RepID=A0AAU9JN30_9CILI|nr:unnamed protein product [Blepharisma stoltei]